MNTRLIGTLCLSLCLVACKDEPMVTPEQEARAEAAKKLEWQKRPDGSEVALKYEGGYKCWPEGEHKACLFIEGTRPTVGTFKRYDGLPDQLLEPTNTLKSEVGYMCMVFDDIKSSSILFRGKTAERSLTNQGGYLSSDYVFRFIDSNAPGEESPWLNCGAVEMARKQGVEILLTDRITTSMTGLNIFHD